MKVLIALDEEPVSLRAAREAVRLLSRFDTEFLVLNVAPLPSGAGPIGAYGDVSAIPEDWYQLTNEPLEEEISHRVEATRERAELVGVEDPEVFGVAGYPADRICDAADEHDVDVIVVGSHDKGMLKQLLDPSVSAEVMRRTYRPVLVVSGAPPSAAD